MAKKKKEEIIIIGVGASAGGLEAIQELLTGLPPKLINAAIVITQHLSPSYKSMLVQLLSKSTKLNVEEITNGMSIKINTVYITPPDSELTIKKDKLFLVKPPLSVGPKPSIDVFFTSLAQEKQNNCIGIILSGTGSDGANGVKAIKKNGGLTLAQEPHSAKYDGMPLSAIQTEQIDLVLSPEKMGEEIIEFLRNPHMIFVSKETENDASDSMTKLFNLLSKRTQTDFSQYKQSTIYRRLEKRLNILKISSIDDYLKLIQEKPAELDNLFQMILIGVTRFFRDGEPFKEINKIIKKIVDQKNEKDSIRIWVPGCATGEEPYSFAILLSEILKEKISNYNIQIFATDIDEKALSIARKGIYPASALEDVSAGIVKKYFRKLDDDYYEISKSIRLMVLFSKHDVAVNPPFLKLDMISCRNLLIYFSLQLQKHVIPIFHYALNPDGILFLGKSETVGQFADLFSSIDPKSKIFKRKTGQSLSALRFANVKTIREVKSVVISNREKTRNSLAEIVKDTLYNTFEHPYVVVNDNMDVQEIFGDVRLYLGLNEGSMNANILKLINKELSLDLHAALTKSVKDRTTVKGKIKKFSLFGKNHYVRLIVKPLIYTDVSNEYYLIVFESFNPEEEKIYNYEDSNLSSDPRIKELETELQATREHLQTYLEELETSNEELQSLNEELQATNEELQSSNEELETSNEELQSTNEELHTAYMELKVINEDLEKKELLLIESEKNLQAILNITTHGYLLINSNFEINSFNNEVKNRLKKISGKSIIRKKTILQFIPSNIVEKFHIDINTAFSGKKVLNKKYTFIGKQKEKTELIVNFIPVKGKADKYSSVVISFIDM